MELKRIAYDVLVETSDDNPVPTQDDVARNLLKLRADYPDVAVYITNARETDKVTAGTWAGGYEYVKATILDMVDNDRKVYEHVLTSVRGTFEDSHRTRAERAAIKVYRILALKLGVTPVGSLDWGRKEETFQDMFIRALISSPADDTSGMWTDIGQYYVNKVTEEDNAK